MRNLGYSYFVFGISGVTSYSNWLELLFEKTHASLIFFEKLWLVSRFFKFLVLNMDGMFENLNFFNNTDMFLIIL